MGSCKACYTGKHKCQYTTDLYPGCARCKAKGIICEPRGRPTSSFTVKDPQYGGEFKDETNFLRLYTSSSSSSKGSLHTSKFDDRGFEISRQARRRSGHRASHSTGATASIDAIQFAASSSLVEQGLLEPSEVVELYHLYMTRWNPCTLILDPCLHSLEYLSRSELLLSVVLAVASQDYPARPNLYDELVHYARRIGGRDLLSHTQTVETIQAFLLLSLFPDWSTSFEQNRSWLDLGLALDLAKQLDISKMALTYDARRGTASSSERNIFRTWMICHNLDAITALVFDRPSLFGSIPRELKRWPTNPDSSPESIVGVLTTPLQHIDAHIKKQSFDKILYGADLIPAIRQGESTISPRRLDSQLIDTMMSGISEAKAVATNSGRINGLVAFWLHLAHVTTEYSKLLLLSKYPSIDQIFQDPKSHSGILDSATSILQSYVDICDTQSCAKFSPGYFFSYGLLAAAVAHKLTRNTDDVASRVRATTLIKRFSDILRLSPTVTRNGTATIGIFTQIVDRIVRDEDTLRAGGTSEALSDKGPVVPMLTTVFPAWWKLYL